MLKTRILTALVLVTVFAVLLFFATPQQWMLFAALVAAIGAWEWGALMRLSPLMRGGFSAAIALIVVVVSPGPGSVSGIGETVAQGLFVVSSIFWLVFAPLWLRGRWQLGSAVLGLLVGGLLLVPTALALVVLREPHPVVLLAVMAAVWVADIGAFFVGRRFGRVKLAPSISPGKSREGAYGAVAAVWVYGTLVLGLGLRPQLSLAGWLGFFALLALLTAVSIMGDLFESLAKRQAGVKDSGTILPGHGGVLDRIDSLTAALPLAALLLSLTSLLG